MTEVVVVSTDSDTVVVGGPQDTQFVVINQTTPSVVELVAQGPQGPQGIQGPQGTSGESSLGGYGVSLSGVASGDLLQFGAGTWVNRPPENLVDGGNF